MKTVLSLFSFLLTISIYSLALAAPTLSISPTGDSTFVVQGADFQGVGGVDITITYDTTTLANPRVSQGSLLSGMTFIPNTGIPGAVRLGAISVQGVSGSGPVATITFDLKGSSPGNVTSLTGSVIDVNGKNLGPRFIPPVSRIASTKDEDKKDEEKKDDEGSASSSRSSAASVPTVTPPPAMTSEETAVSQAGKKHQMETTAPAREDIAETTQPAPEKKYTVIGGIIERFRDFQGEKTPNALIALAEADTDKAYSQAPPISLSDGETKVKITIKADVSDNSAPNFALDGASLVRLEKNGDDSWIVEALPNKGVYQSSLTVIDSEAITEYPLTVAPKVTVKTTKSGTLSEKDFALFLKERGTEKSPSFDLDGDGKRTYIDDYIYTLNYIVGLKSK